MVNVENWLTHPVFVDYEVSDLGAVRRRTAKGGTRAGRMKQPSLTKNGYLTVNIERKPRKVHALVLECFVGPRPEKHDACHNDGTRTNNVLSNLRWATRKENMRDAVGHGTAQSSAEKLREYWSKHENRAAQSERVKRFVLEHPEQFAVGAEIRRKASASPGVRLKMRLAKLGKKQSPETAARRAAANRGKKRGPYAP